MIRLVVSDMDGTLINERTEISPKNLEAIHKLEEHHIEFAIASGRDYEGVYSIIHDYGLHCEAILGNGAQYVNRDGHVVMDCYMDKSVFQDVISIFEDAHVPFMVFTTKGFYTTQEPEYVRQSFIQRSIVKFHREREEYEEGAKSWNVPCNHLQHIDDVEEFLKRDLEIIKVEAFSLDSAEITPCKEKLIPVPTISFLSSFDDNVEVTDQNAQKGFILEKVAQIKGLKKEEIMVLGDGMNDLTLFQCFPYSFAPSNAEQEIQDLAYKVVCDCNDDGFAQAIEIMLEELGD